MCSSLSHPTASQRRYHRQPARRRKKVLWEHSIGILWLRNRNYAPYHYRFHMFPERFTTTTTAEKIFHGSLINENAQYNIAVWKSGNVGASRGILFAFRAETFQVNCSTLLHCDVPLDVRRRRKRSHLNRFRSFFLFFAPARQESELLLMLLLGARSLA